MEKIFLVIVFVAGLYHSVEQWKGLRIYLTQLIAIHKSRYSQEDPPDCHCSNCKGFTEEQKKETRQTRYEDAWNSVLKASISHVIYAIFVSGLSLIILFIIFN